MESKNLRVIVERLCKGAELKSKLREIAIEYNISSGFIISLCGCLTHVKLKLPSAFTKKYKAYNADTGEKIEKVLVYDVFEENGLFEINSGIGTISKENIHVHLNINKPDGTCIGGHLLTGSIVFTTVELGILVIDDIRMFKGYDKDTGHKEMQLEKI